MLRKTLPFISGLLIATGLMVFDELLTLAMYCGRNCQYPIPLLGVFTLYGAEGFAWILILAGILLLIGDLSKKTDSVK